MSNQSTSLNELLRQQLLVARQLDRQAEAVNTSGTMLEIPDTGKMLSSAYEQLRNAAEYSEEHLLLQRAIKRFCKRNLFLIRRQTHTLGTELIVELVQAGYLEDGEFSKATATELDTLLHEYMACFSNLRQSHVNYEVAMNWILAFMSCEAENILNPHHAQQATVFFAYQHFLQALPRQQFSGLRGNTNYEVCLYIAVHQALMKSDVDVVRHELLALYKQSPKDTHNFKQLNEQIDELFNSPLTQQLKRVISRYGAPFRVLKNLIEENPNTAEILPDEKLFINTFEKQIFHEYQQVGERLNRRLLKSIAFIFITKVLIGIAIEIPYDLIVYGTVFLLPLAVNLLFPPLYMATLVVSLRLPSEADAKAVREAMRNLLYGNSDVSIVVPERRKSSVWAKLLYALLLMVPLTITVYVLDWIGFNMVQMVIFFIFFSTASFLAFRISAMVRELQLTTHHSGLLASLWESFYGWFVVRAAKSTHTPAFLASAITRIVHPKVNFHSLCVPARLDGYIP